jgi:hypothetical protein
MMMLPAKRSLVFLSSLLLTGCLLTPPLTTTTEVITAGDAFPVFGTQTAIGVGPQQLVFRWDAASHAYRSHSPDGGLVKAVRAARLKGDVYLLQAEVEEAPGEFVLVPFRVSTARDVAPLVCDVTRTGAETFGVRAGSEGLSLQLAGDRAGILSLLASVASTCKPQLRVDTFVPSPRELMSQVAAIPNGSSGGCKPCPLGACVQGTVRDVTDAPLSGATIRAAPGSGGGPLIARSDASGNFLLAGLPDGKVDVRIEQTAFSALKLPPIQVKSGATYLFDEPFRLELAQPPFEQVASPRQPRVCTGSRR